MAVRQAAETITADRLKASLTFLASDELEGRATPSRGLDIAAKYLASRLDEIGVTPAGDAGSYFQRIDLLHLVVDPARTWVDVGGERFPFPDGFGAGMNWLHRTTGSARGPLVYVGDGLGEDRFSGVTISNKIVVISLRTSRTREELIAARVTPQEMYVREHGARGIIWLEDDRRFASWDRERLARETRPGLSLQDPGVPYTRQVETLPSIIAGKDLMQAIFEGENFSAPEIIAREDAGNPVPAFDLHKEVSFSLSVRPREVAATQNVIAVLEGSDDALKHEFVVIGAHYDGVPQPPWGCYSYWQFQSQSYPGQVFHNAYDNGSGTVAILNIAEAMMKAPRPRRSVLFVLFTGEECGGVGSRYFTHLPTVPLSSIIAFLNFDSVGADQGPQYANVEIEIAGTRRISDDLWKLSKSVNDAYLRMKAAFGEDDGGDARPFMLKQIPFLYFQNGEGPRMHVPSDRWTRSIFESWNGSPVRDLRSLGPSPTRHSGPGSPNERFCGSPGRTRTCDPSVTVECPATGRRRRLARAGRMARRLQRPPHRPQATSHKLFQRG